MDIKTSNKRKMCWLAWGQVRCEWPTTSDSKALVKVTSIRNIATLSQLAGFKRFTFCCLLIRDLLGTGYYKNIATLMVHVSENANLSPRR